MKPIKLPTYWQRIWILSKANGGFYVDDDLPRNPIQWRTSTWFQQRLEQVRGRDDSET